MLMLFLLLLLQLQLQLPVASAADAILLLSAATVTAHAAAAAAVHVPSHIEIAESKNHHTVCSAAEPEQWVVLRTFVFRSLDWNEYWT